MDSLICKTCTHFIQHYFLDAQYCGALECGHCSHRRVKHRKPHSAACGHYAARETDPSLPDRDRLIHFLTTEFLQKILQMELPPEIRK